MGDISSWVGMVLQTLGILGAVGMFVLRLHLDLRLLIQAQVQVKNVVDSHDTQLKQMGQILIDLARQDMRLTNAEARIHELSTRLYDHIRKDELERS